MSRARRIINISELKDVDPKDFEKVKYIAKTIFGGLVAEKDIEFDGKFVSFLLAKEVDYLEYDYLIDLAKSFAKKIDNIGIENGRFVVSFYPNLEKISL